MKKTIIYIGGYQSSGHKAGYFGERLSDNLITFAPDYDKEDPSEIRNGIIEALKSALSKGEEVHIIGSSTGGMTALLLQPYFNVKMHLINPLLAKEQFFDQEHPVGPQLKPLSEVLLNQTYLNNKINIYLGTEDELLNPEYTREFASNKNIEVIEFSGDHAGVGSLDLIIDDINNN